MGRSKEKKGVKIEITLFEWAANQEQIASEETMTPSTETEVETGKRKSLHERFMAFDQANPQVYALFRKYALQLYANGRRRYGAKSIFERVRWEMTIHPDPRRQTDGQAEPFKINNDYISRYARKLVAELPQFADFFEMRQLHSEE